MRLRPLALIGLHALVPFGLAGPAHAADVANEAADRLAFAGQKLSEWKVVLGGGARIGPKYEGSDEFKIQPLPFISATFGDRVMVTPRGVSVDVYSVDNLKFRGLLGYEMGRQESDSDHLRGLGDIDMGATIGAMVAYQLGPAEFFASLNRTVGGSEGLEAKFGVDLKHKVDRFLLSARASATWADETYMTTYFGVTADQSARSGLPQYDIGAGLKRADFDFSVTYMATQHWLLRGQVGVGYLLGDAADSPIVQRAFQPSVMLSVGYRF